MDFLKTYDVFIAYHGSYDLNGSKKYADQIYEYLTDKGLKCFYFPRSAKDIYKANIIEVLKSRTFLLVCTKGLHTIDGRIDNAHHYELSTEIDAFYAMTQMGSTTVKEAKVIACGEYMKGDEGHLHELFANRTHFYFNGESEVLSSIHSWVLRHGTETLSWGETQKTTEIKQVFATRASMKESCHFDDLIASAKSVRAAGISNSELTARINPGAIRNCIERGGKIEILFLEPEGTYTPLREKEEGLRPNRIRNITNINMETAQDMRDSLNDLKENLSLYVYDEQPRMNIIMIDDYLLLQYYSNNMPCIQNPSFLIERQKDSPVFDFCEAAYNYLKSKAKRLEE